MKGDWYFDGYEGRKIVDNQGKSRSSLIYTGEYYGFARGQDPRPIKLACLSASLVYFLCYFFNALNNSGTAQTFYVGLPLMLSMVPGIYLLIGTGCFMPAKEEMTVRVCYSSLRRMDRSLRFIVPMLTISALGGLYHFIRTPALFASWPDLRYFLFVLLALAATLFEFRLLRKNPVVIVRNPEPESMRMKDLEQKMRKEEDKKFQRHHFRKNP